MTREYANFNTDAFFSSLCGKPLGKGADQTRYKCPKSVDKTRDIYISPTGAWKCHHAKCASQKGCHVTGGGPRQFLSLVNPSLKDKDAFEMLNKYGRNSPSPNKQQAKHQEKPSKTWRNLDDIKAWLLSKSPKGKDYRDVTIHEYPQADGSPCMAVFRCEPGKEKSKDFFQYHKQSAGWVAGGIKEKRPLYRLTVVANESGLPVIVCEGEKKADVLHKALPGLLYWVTSPPQGAQSPNKADWKTVKGRPVFILPDNDEPGLAFAEKVSALCLEAGASSVAIIEPFYGKEPNDSRDIANFLEECGSPDTIIEAIKKTPIKPPPGKKNPSELSQAQKQPKNILKTVSAQELEKMEFPPIRWVVPNILGEGYAILSGRPKRGKSWFALGLSLAVASGGYVLGKIRVEPGDVLYLALEDNLRRLQNRLQKLNEPGRPLPSRLHLITDIPPLKDGGAEAIRNWLNAHPKTRLVVVDTVSHPRFIPPRGKGGDIFQEDYRFGAWLQKLAHEHHLGLLGLNHTKKTEVTYAVDAVSGSTGITAPADTILVIDSAIKGKASAVLHITGRDVPAQELALKFENSSWSLMGEAEEFTVTDQRKQVIDILRNHGAMNPKEIAERTKSSRGAIRKLLFEMRRANLITQVGGAKSKYTLSSQCQDTLPISSDDEDELL